MSESRLTSCLNQIPLIVSMLLISLSTVRASSVNTLQREGQSIQPNSQIAFVSREQQGDSLVIIDPITHVQKLLAQYQHSRIVGFPVWSPDCKFILVDQIDADNKKYVTRVDVETSPNSQNIIPSQLNITAYFPKWSPDGNKLLFQAVDFSEGPRNPDIYTLWTSENKFK